MESQTTYLIKNIECFILSHSGFTVITFGNMKYFSINYFTDFLTFVVNMIKPKKSDRSLHFTRQQYSRDTPYLHFDSIHTVWSIDWTTGFSRSFRDANIFHRKQGAYRYKFHCNFSIILEIITINNSSVRMILSKWFVIPYFTAVFPLFDVSTITHMTWVKFSYTLYIYHMETFTVTLVANQANFYKWDKKLIWLIKNYCNLLT